MGVALGLLHKTTREIIRRTRAITNSSEERQAIALAAGLPHSRLRIADEAGYVRFGAADIGSATEVKKVARLARGWQKDPNRNASDKPFLRNILRSEDLFDHPEIIGVATHPQLFGAVTQYLGQVPWLVNLQVWWTPPNKTAIRSQLYHYDHRDTRQAKVFINLNEVDDNAGPLHFLSAASSEKVNRKIGYSQDEYTDEQVAGCIEPQEVVRTVGPAGAGFVVDTARCLHYGSRGNTKDRLILMISYARVNCVSKGAGCEVLDPVREKLTETYFRNDAARTFANRIP
jgi:hypothetical protein